MLLLGGACGGTSSPPAEPKSKAVSSVQDVADATILIQVKGGVLSQLAAAMGEGGDGPSFGQGSGFIISEDGLAVTANHVVTGGGSYDVYVGDTDKPVNASLVGISECSDLALIDLEGGGYEYLEWVTGEIRSGLKVSAAGFPGEPGSRKRPAYTLTDGTINNTEATGMLGTSAVDSVLEHSAQIRPGSSGGPLVDENGKVVGINYAGQGGETGTRYFAVSRDEALEILEDLRGGDVLSLGVNGTAIQGGFTLRIRDREIPRTGILVISTKAGSPVNEVGVKAAETASAENQRIPNLPLKRFDVIRSLQDTPVGIGDPDIAAYTLEDYCDILRTHGQDTPLRMEMTRFERDGNNVIITDLEGTLNSGEKLEQSSPPIRESAREIEIS